MISKKQAWLKYKYGRCYAQFLLTYKKQFLKQKP